MDVDERMDRAFRRSDSAWEDMAGWTIDAGGLAVITEGTRFDTLLFFPKEFPQQREVVYSLTHVDIRCPDPQRLAGCATITSNTRVRSRSR